MGIFNIPKVGKRHILCANSKSYKLYAQNKDYALFTPDASATLTISVSPGYDSIELLSPGVGSSSTNSISCFVGDIISYKVIKAGYADAIGSVTVTQASQTENVTLTAIDGSSTQQTGDMTLISDYTPPL